MRLNLKPDLHFFEHVQDPVTPKIWITIVNYRTAKLAIDCLRSIAEQIAETSNLRAIVIDNASGDRSVEELTAFVEGEGWQTWVSVVSLDRNGGFAFGNNVGIVKSLRSPENVDYIMLLNPDTLVQDGAIRALLEFMESHEAVGIAGSHLQNAVGRPESSAHNAPSPLGELVAGARLGALDGVLQRYVVTPPIRRDAHPCDWVSGASLIVRRKVFDDVGLLDEGYFLYFEEVDFCRRAKKAGWEIWFVPESRIVHFEGSSTGIRKIAQRRPGYWYDSRRRYFVKHFGVLGLVAADILWVIGRSSLLLRRALRLGSGGAAQDPKWFTLDLVWGDLRALLTGAIWRIGREPRP